MALIIKLFVNERQIAEYSALRIRGKAHELCCYELDHRTRIDHHYDDGAEALAAKVLLHQLTRKKEA